MTKPKRRKRGWRQNGTAQVQPPPNLIIHGALPTASSRIEWDKARPIAVPERRQPNGPMVFDFSEDPL